VRIRRQLNERSDPWTAPDPALALALQQLRYYARNRDRYRRTYRASELLILLATATTTVAAALKASAWVTATLAASTVVLTGFHKVLDSHNQWVAFVGAWAELQAAVNDDRLLPVDRRDEEARRRIVDKMNEILRADTQRWSSQRRNVVKRND
jgi:hypothetical protein